MSTVSFGKDALSPDEIAIRTLYQQLLDSWIKGAVLSSKDCQTPPKRWHTSFLFLEKHRGIGRR